MINADIKNDILNMFEAGAEEMFDEVKGNYPLVDAMNAGDADTSKSIIKKIQQLMVANIPAGVKVPKVSLYISPMGTSTVSIINIKITNKVANKGIKTFGFNKTITNTNPLEEVYKFMLSVYEILITDELAEENLAKVNDVLSQAVNNSGVDYEIKVVTSLGNKGKKIASISDDEIVFVADDDRVFDLDDIIALLDDETDTISYDVIQEQYESLVKEIASAQTTPQLVGIHGGSLVAYVCDINKRLKPITLIKKVYSKNVFKLTGDKDTVAYYFLDNVYSALSRRDGAFDVVLSPFDVDTLQKVDIDIIQKLG